MQRRIRSAAQVAGGVRQQPVELSKTTKIVDGLLDFAGTVAPVVTQELNKKVEADKAIQMARAWKGEGPSDDATKAGYKASYLVAAKMRGLRASKQLQADANLGSWTDDEFEAKIAETMGGIQDELGAQYPAIQNDPELAKAFSLQMTEVMPALVDSRYSAQIKQEQTVRYNDTYALAYESIENLSSEDTPAALEGLMKATKVLQMSEAEREKMLLQLAKNTGNVGVFEFAKSYKGSSENDLFARSGAMQQLERQTKRKMTHEQEIAFWTDKDDLLDKFAAGGLTRKEFEQGSLRLKDVHGRGLSQDEYMSAINAREKRQVVVNDQTRWMEDLDAKRFVDFTKSDGKKATDAEKTAFVDQVRADTFDDYADEIQADDTQEGRQNGDLAKTIDRAWRGVIKVTDNLGKQSGSVSNEFKGRLNNIATYDVAQNVQKVKGADGIERYTMPGVSRTAGGVLYEGPADDFNLLVRMPLSRLSAYAEGDNLAVLQKTRAYIDGGASPAEAIMQAQYDVRKGTVQLSGNRKANIKSVLVSPDSGLVWDDAIPATALPMMTRNLMNSTINFETDDFQKRAALDEIKNNYYFMPDGSPIKGSANRLKEGLIEELRANGVDVDGSNLELGDWFGDARSMMLPFAKTHFRNQDLKAEEIQFDVQDDYVTFVSGDKVLPYKVPLARLGSMVYKWKKENYVAPKKPPKRYNTQRGR